MFRSVAITTALLVLTSAAAAQAQGRFDIELRGGAAFPTRDLGDATLKTGGGAEATVGVRLLPHLHVYGGWDYFSFVMDKPLAGNKYDVEETGYAFGMAFRHPLYNQVGGWVRGGGLYSHIELENTAGDIVVDSGHELGWEVGGGLSVPVGSGFSVTPGVRYRSLSTDLAIGSTTVPVDLGYVAAEVGVRWTFGAPRGMTTARAR